MELLSFVKLKPGIFSLNLPFMKQRLRQFLEQWPKKFRIQGLNIEDMIPFLAIGSKRRWLAIESLLELQGCKVSQFAT